MCKFLSLSSARFEFQFVFICINFFQYVPFFILVQRENDNNKFKDNVSIKNAYYV